MKQFLLIFSIIFVIQSGFIDTATIVYAEEILYQQPYWNEANNFYYKQNTTGSVYQDLGSGLNGIITGISTTYQFNQASPPSKTINHQLLCFTDSGYTNPCANSTIGEISGNLPTGSQWATTTLPSSYLLYPAYYYRLVETLISSPSGYFYIFGTTTNQWVAGSSNTDNMLVWNTKPEDIAFKLLGGTFASTTSHFDNLSPTDASTTASTDVSFSFDYYYNSTNNNYQYVGISLKTYSGTSTTSHISIPIQADVLTHFSTTTSLTTSMAYYWSPEMFYETPTYDNGYYYDRLNILIPYKIYIINNPFKLAIGLSNPENNWGLATSTCSITNITGCFQNALIFILVPHQETIDNFAYIKNMVMKKPPLGYWSLISTAYNSLSASSSPFFIFPTSTVMTNTIFNPIKIGLASCLWLAWGITIIKIISNFVI